MYIRTNSLLTLVAKVTPVPATRPLTVGVPHHLGDAAHRHRGHRQRRRKVDVRVHLADVVGEAVREGVLGHVCGVELGLAARPVPLHQEPDDQQGEAEEQTGRHADYQVQVEPLLVLWKRQKGTGEARGPGRRRVAVRASSTDEGCLRFQ